MEIVYHLGAHGTDKDRLLRALLQNRDELWREKVEIPAPNRYRGVFGEAMNALGGGQASAEMQEVLLDSILDGDRAERLVLSQPGFLGMPLRAISAQGLYANAGDRVMALANLFPDSTVEFFLAIKHPASLIMSVIEASGRSYDELMAGTMPGTLRWAPMVRRVLQAAQGRRVVVWCNEDTPLIWPEILRRIADIPAQTRLSSTGQVLAEILPPEALRAHQAELDANPDITLVERRALTEKVLAEHAIATKVDIELPLPGWRQDMLDAMTEDYDTDVAQIAALPGIEFIAP
ncbi:MAG: hypothetical protein Q4F71_02045 [Paracoccus sp. (in: a-proteobacteria)]|nr:hypothetical protein [Paracoccus sp. (in: a-proteobacteria)]